jgi:hypothetical protein
MIEPPVLSRRQICQLLGALAIPSGSRAAEKTAVEAPVVIEDGRLWISARIGERSFRFIIDTGAASNFIRPDIAKELRLANVSVGNAVSGVGGRSRIVGAVEASNVIIGGAVRQNRMIFSTYDFGRGLPTDAAGLLAAGVVTAYDCDLAMGETVGKWRIWPNGRNVMPEGAPLTGATVAHRNQRDGSERIVMTVAIDGQSYRLLADTGSPRAITLFSRSVERSGLWDAPAWAPQMLAGFGGAAARLSRTTRATRLELGPLALKRPFVTLADPAQAPFGDVDGLIGLPLLSLFDLSIDASASKVWVHRNVRKPTVDAYGRSGLWLKREGDGASIGAVGAGSPAAGAGLRPGDRVVGSFADAYRAANGDAGKPVELDVARDGAPVKARFVLADYL